MKRRIFTPLFLAIVIFAACGDDKSAKVQPPPPQPVDAGPAPAAVADKSPALKTDTCDTEIHRLIADLQKKVGNEFTVSLEKAGTIIASRVIRTEDGQRVREDLERLAIESENGKCVLKPVEASRAKLNERRVMNLVNGAGSYYRDDELRFTEAPLRQGAWWKSYAAYEYIGGNNKADMRVNTSWLVTDENGYGELAAHLPVWTIEGVWTEEANDKYVLLAGRVTLLNPNAVHPDEFTYVMRFNKQGTVNVNGILYPVSKKSYEGYLQYQRGQADDWIRATTDDERARLAAIAAFHKDAKLGARLGKEVAIKKVYRQFGAEPDEPPINPKGFMPDFLDNRTLF